MWEGLFVFLWFGMFPESKQKPKGWGKGQWGGGGGEGVRNLGRDLDTWSFNTFSELFCHFNPSEYYGQ